MVPDDRSYLAVPTTLVGALDRKSLRCNQTSAPGLGLSVILFRVAGNY